MATELYRICSLGNGALFVMPKPCSENMDSDIAHYRQQGVTKIVSLLLPEEVKKLGMQHEAAHCEQHGLNFTHFPIKDMSVPELGSLQSFNRQLKDDLLDGQHIAIHCHGGRGRAGTVAITLMTEFGLDVQTAMETASKARGDRMPVCEEQIVFVTNYPYQTGN